MAETFKQHLHGRFGAEFAVMTIGGDEQLPAITESESHAVLVGVGVGISLARAAAG